MNENPTHFIPGIMQFLLTLLLNTLSETFSYQTKIIYKRHNPKRNFCKQPANQIDLHVVQEVKRP